MTMSGASRRCVAMALMACGHCGDLRRVRTEGQFVSCDSCGKVLQERPRKQHAVAEARRQLRRRRWLGARKRRGDARAADGTAAAGGEDMVLASDAESGTAGARLVESSYVILD